LTIHVVRRSTDLGPTGIYEFHSIVIQLQLCCSVPLMQASFPRWTATRIRWRRKDVDNGSRQTSAITHPISEIYSSTCWPHTPDAIMATEMKLLPSPVLISSDLCCYPRAVCCMLCRPTHTIVCMCWDRWGHKRARGLYPPRYLSTVSEYHPSGILSMRPLSE